MEELTFAELSRQCYACLKNHHFENLKGMQLKIIDTAQCLVESDEDVLKAYANDEMLFNVTLMPLQQSFCIKKKCEYKHDQNMKHIKADITNFQELFEKELQYNFVCNEKSEMTKECIKDFMDSLIVKHELRKNTKLYDALLVILCGYGRGDGMLITSEQETISLDYIRARFNHQEIPSLKDCPKIFIVDLQYPKIHTAPMKIINQSQKIYGHDDDGFLIISSIPKAHTEDNLSLLSKCMKNTISSMYKTGYSLNQMLQSIRDDIRKSKTGEWYSIETRDTTDYDIFFEKKNS
ncbi:hypothetical protein RFI_15372 [Reticulomyxa filosa]|uniref:Caspase family p20 domain-containing protein n=1 Tax=Reticulomyxa filosa TaxID=46433 RepID=X6N962_RETFI|nr:hypothetical protein RFI_15372 [Reticulomyxa filosa]|eukprot:ETO21832.1 hypothetical protein RFI_15372 [Reticulomyxa filosa]